jgi:glycosyltransferase involved in cell wall biosynthesis
VETLLFALRKNVIYDFDDAIYLAPSDDNSLARKLLRCDWRVGYICHRSSLVGVGNDYLAAYARKHNKHVVIWPTSIDTEWSRPPNVRPATLTVGWTGSASTVNYIKSILPEIAKLQKDHDFRFLIVGGDLDLDAHGVTGECRPWRAKDEVAFLQEMDIGLMPLANTPWESGKCSLKALQYQSVGIPAIASDVGMNRKAVLDGKTGLLVPPGGGWSQSIAKLLGDAELRRRMGIAACAHVETHYSGRVVAPKVLADIRSLFRATPLHESDYQIGHQRP